MQYSSYNPLWNNPLNIPYLSQVMPVAQQQAYGIVKVNGPESAMQYPVPPNTQSPALFDNAGGVFYIVTADGAGSKTIEAFDYTPHVEPQSQQPADLYVTRSEYTDLLARFQQLQQEVSNGIHGPVQPAATAVGTTAAVNDDAGIQAQQHQTGGQQ